MKNPIKKNDDDDESTYFGHVAFTLYTGAYYFKNEISNETVDSVVDKDPGLNTLPVVIISYQTVHERNIVFSCNHKLIEFI